MEQPELSVRDRAARARRRALRAASVVTLSLALAGCSLSHSNGDAGARVDSGSAPDAGDLADAGSMPDAGSLPDAGEVADAGPCVTFEDARRTQECCEQQYGYWNDGACFIAVEGPRVPPAMTA